MKIDIISIPLINTILLLSSGIIITSSNFSNNLKYKIENIEKGIRIILIFLLFQFLEYTYSPFDFTSSTYGNLFYMITRITWNTYDNRRDMIIYRIYKSNKKRKREWESSTIYSFCWSLMILYLHLPLFNIEGERNK